jgi:hypothetical protein
MDEGPNMQDAGEVRATLLEAADILLSHEGRRGCIDLLPDHGRLLVTGDLHDNPFHLRKIIDLTRLDGSADHHVVLHELIHGDRLLNGMDFSYRVLVRVAQLVLTYPGQVHPMLANHELAQLTNRAVSKGAGNSVILFDNALEYTFGDDMIEVRAAIDAFFRAMALAVRSATGVFCAHSLPNAHAMKHFDIDVLLRPLNDDDYMSPTGAAYLMTWGRQYDEDTIARLAEAWDVTLFCLGHQKVETGIEAAGDRVVLLNSDHERGAVLPIDLAHPPTALEAVMHGIPLASLGDLE